MSPITLNVNFASQSATMGIKKSQAKFKEISERLSTLPSDKVSISTDASVSGVDQDKEAANAFRDEKTAQEAADTAKNFILSNPNTAMAAQAHQLPGSILNLLG